LKTESETTTTTTTVDKSLSLKIEFPIIKDVAGSIGGKLEGSYTDTEINISSFTIENSFQLKIQIQKLQEHDANKYFSIEPYFYIDNSNVIRCKYRCSCRRKNRSQLLGVLLQITRFCYGYAFSL